MKRLFEFKRFEAQCRGKQKHGSKGKADAAARSYEDRFGGTMAVYPCKFCKGWHVGHSQ